MGTSATVQLDRLVPSCGEPSYDIGALISVPQDVRDLIYDRMRKEVRYGSGRDFVRLVEAVTAADRLAFEYMQWTAQTAAAGLKVRLETNDPHQLGRIHELLESMQGETDATLPQVESIQQAPAAPAAARPPGDGSK